MGTNNDASKYVIIHKADDGTSDQVLRSEVMQDGVLHPFFSFETALDLYYANIYHSRSCRIKAGMLSQVESTDLDARLDDKTTPSSFLYGLILNLEIYGNAFIEIAGTDSKPTYHIIPSFEGRLDKERNVYQYVDGIPRILDEGAHLLYYSPASRFYGEPDYLAVWRKLSTDKLIDEYNEAFFINGAKPDLAVIFENSEPTQSQLDVFNTFFRSSFKGAANAHKTLIMSTGMGETTNGRIRIEDLNKVEDMAFEKLRATNRDEIVAAHGVPPRMVGVITPGQIGGGNELLSQLHQFNETVVIPKIELIQEFFQGLGVNLKLRPLDVTSFVDDASVVGGLVSMGIITEMEAREILGWKKGAVA